MPLNYDKWNKLEDYSSSEDEEATKAARRLRAPSMNEARPGAKLITVPWDSTCEAIRWALDRHGLAYIEYDNPWGIHLWDTLGYSDPFPRPQQKP
ncbi:hypothetical protein BDK51DRAFT_37331 [Blyttiomyces helicus]|uniref:Uncharacterized protein n=1 Tax=Blyttiomyces helicus TaxID=388810 RepID=A0A4P9WGN1_9FUNG|nr:hypothetical protein BDK51DRAFT_37331 [Blyttiomyces helicus]|eukprot:RKO91959.1 hypothetical protein BDK51DRAFT_37331 [Blyttiomyces helicus]